VTVIEHAGADWTVRDPMEITNWFNRLVRRLSPSGELGAAIEAGASYFLTSFPRTEEHGNSIRRFAKELIPSFQ